MLLTARAPLPLERSTLSSQKTNLFLFHQNVLTDLADLSWEMVYGGGEGGDKDGHNPKSHVACLTWEWALSSYQDRVMALY